MEERSILTEYTHLCGYHAVMWLQDEFRSDYFNEWMSEQRPELAMSSRVEFTTNVISNRMPGCGCCWSESRNNLAEFTVVWMVDGDG